MPRRRSVPRRSGTVTAVGPVEMKSRTVEPRGDLGGRRRVLADDVSAGSVSLAGSRSRPRARPARSWRSPSAAGQPDDVGDRDLGHLVLAEVRRQPVHEGGDGGECHEREDDPATRRHACGPAPRRARPGCRCPRAAGPAARRRRRPGSVPPRAQGAPRWRRLRHDGRAGGRPGEGRGRPTCGVADRPAQPDGLEVGAELVGGLVARVTRLRERVEHHGIQVLGQPLDEARRRRPAARRRAGRRWTPGSRRGTAAGR